jgi:hypothetical protein
MSNTLKSTGLTGQFSFRYNFWGSLVLWVQETCVYLDDNDASPEFKQWRKAEEEDLNELDLR